MSIKICMNWYLLYVTVKDHYKTVIIIIRYYNL
jgi:hypothetical protein